MHARLLPFQTRYAPQRIKTLDCMWALGDHFVNATVCDYEPIFIIYQEIDSSGCIDLTFGSRYDGYLSSADNDRIRGNNV